MKTFVRLIRRYVLAAVGIVLLLLFSGVAVLGWLGWQEGCRLPQREYSSSEIADSMVETAEGLAFGAERTPQEWMNGYEWAMVLVILSAAMSLRWPEAVLTMCMAVPHHRKCWCRCWSLRWSAVTWKQRMQKLRWSASSIRLRT